MKVFISQPMVDKSNEEIEKERERIINKISEISGNNDIEIIDSFFKDAPHDAKPLWFLGKAFELLSTADLAFFAKGWDKYRGCRMEYQACKEYGIYYIDENFYNKENT